MTSVKDTLSSLFAPPVKGGGMEISMYYDYLIVGAGLYGAVCAYELKKAGKSVLVIEKRPHIAGNIYTEEEDGIIIHRYGPHIFHTNEKEIWEYANHFAGFNHFVNSPVANYKGEIYSLPFNMYTFHKMWGVSTPKEAELKLNLQRSEAYQELTGKRGKRKKNAGDSGSICIPSENNAGVSGNIGAPTENSTNVSGNIGTPTENSADVSGNIGAPTENSADVYQPENLEEQALLLVGRNIYERLIKGYTQKQWGRPCTELPAFLIKRLPVRLTYDNNYFDARYQGIPVNGYTELVANLLDGVEVRLNTDFLAQKEELSGLAKRIIFTGPIDAWFDHSLGYLSYRSLNFENERMSSANYQGNAVVNYTDAETPWTRIIEHKWFAHGKDPHGNEIPHTVITREYSAEWDPSKEPFYPVNDKKNEALFAAYRELAVKEPQVRFGGRLGEYRYYDMDQVIAAALRAVREELEGVV